MSDIESYTSEYLPKLNQMLMYPKQIDRHFIDKVSTLYELRNNDNISIIVQDSPKDVYMTALQYYITVGRKGEYFSILPDMLTINPNRYDGVTKMITTFVRNNMFNTNIIYDQNNAMLDKNKLDLTRPHTIQYKFLHDEFLAKFNKGLSIIRDSPVNLNLVTDRLTGVRGVGISDGTMVLQTDDSNRIRIDSNRILGIISYNTYGLDESYFNTIRKNKQYDTVIEMIPYGMVYYAQVHNTLIISMNPEYMKFDGYNRLHNSKGPAVKWINGDMLYYVHGLRFNQDDFEKIFIDGDISYGMFLRNTEARSSIIKHFGYEMILAETDSKLLDTYITKSSVTGNDCICKLYRIGNLTRYDDGDAMCIIVLEDHTTHKHTFLPVPPDTYNVKDGLAWSFNISNDLDDDEEIKEIYNINIET